MNRKVSAAVPNFGRGFSYNRETIGSILYRGGGIGCAPPLPIYFYFLVKQLKYVLSKYLVSICVPSDFQTFCCLTKNTSIATKWVHQKNFVKLLEMENTQKWMISSRDMVVSPKLLMETCCSLLRMQKKILFYHFDLSITFI